LLEETGRILLCSISDISTFLACTAVSVSEKQVGEDKVFRNGCKPQNYTSTAYGFTQSDSTLMRLRTWGWTRIRGCRVLAAIPQRHMRIMGPPRIVPLQKLTEFRDADSGSTLHSIHPRFVTITPRPPHLSVSTFLYACV
jgi:hypothetical protein